MFHSPKLLKKHGTIYHIGKPPHPQTNLPLILTPPFY